MKLSDLRSKGCLSNWFPVIEAAGLPVPKTRIIKTDIDLVELCDGRIPSGFTAFLNELIDAALDVGVPAFLRTGQTSGKHAWKHTCYLDDLENLEDRVFHLVKYSHIVDLLGLDTSVWAVREMLPVVPAFYAFTGLMPITKERRYFVEGERVLCRHAYWPQEAFEDQYTSVEHWKMILDAINTEEPAEVELLSERTRKAGRAIEGAWSVDWLWTKRGWVLIDCAPAEHSWHWPGCVNEGLCLI